MRKRPWQKSRLRWGSHRHLARKSWNILSTFYIFPSLPLCACDLSSCTPDCVSKSIA